MVKEVVVSYLQNRIYYANILKSGLMGEQRKDITDEVIRAMFVYMRNQLEKTGKSGLKIDGFGEIRFTPEKRNENEKVF